MDSPRKTTTIAEMIHRFRNAPPTSRYHRDAMRRNGDLPERMWWENEDQDKLSKEWKEVKNNSKNPVDSS